MINTDPTSSFPKYLPLCLQSLNLAVPFLTILLFTDILLSVFSRRDHHNIPKRSGKFALVFVPDLAGNLCYCRLRLPEQHGGLSDTVLFHIGSDGLSVNAFKCVFQCCSIDKELF